MPTTLNHGSADLLRSALNQPGWAKTLEDIYAGGKLLSNFTEVPKFKPETSGDYNTWADTVCSLDLSDKALEVCKKCLRHHIDKGLLAPSPWLNQLIEALSLQP